MFEEDVIPRVDQEDFKTSGSFIYSYDLTFMLLTKVEHTSGVTWVYMVLNRFGFMTYIAHTLST